jgi:hypothetical protein
MTSYRVFAGVAAACAALLVVYAVAPEVFVFPPPAFVGRAPTALFAPPAPPAHAHAAPLVLPDISGPARAASDAVLPNSLTFLAIGDWGRGGRGGQEETAPALAAWAAATGAAFVVSVGDSVYVDGVPRSADAAAVDAMMRAYFTDVYTAPALAALPWYAIFGNHVRAAPAAQSRRVHARAPRNGPRATRRAPY